MTDDAVTAQAKRRLTAFAYATLVAIVAVVVLEGAVRRVGLAPPLIDRRNWVRDPLIPYKQRPSSTRHAAPEPGAPEIEYQHNSLGFRDQEHEQRKPPGVFRIVAVGDSFTYGIGAPFKDTYLVRLERLLNERVGSERIEIIKLGMPRYFPAAEALVLEHYGLAFEPDLVLVGVLPNDVIDTYQGLDAVIVDESGFLISRQAQRLGRAGVALYLRSHVMRIILARAMQPDTSITPDQIWKDNGAYESAWKAMESDLERMEALAKRAGARFAVLSIPQGSLWGPATAYVPPRLSRWSAAHDAIFVSPLAALRAENGSAPLYWEEDGHCTGAGYAVIAATLADVLAPEILEHAASGTTR